MITAFDALKENANAAASYIAGAGLRATKGLSEAAETAGDEVSHATFRAAQWEKYMTFALVLGGGIGVIALLFVVGG